MIGLYDPYDISTVYTLLLPPAGTSYTLLTLMEISKHILNSIYSYIFKSINISV